MRKVKCDKSVFFKQVGRTKTHRIFQTFYHKNICTSVFYKHAILHSQTSWIMQVVPYKSGNYWGNYRFLMLFFKRIFDKVIMQNVSTSFKVNIFCSENIDLKLYFFIRYFLSERDFSGILLLLNQKNMYWFKPQKLPSLVWMKLILIYFFQFIVFDYSQISC